MKLLEIVLLNVGTAGGEIKIGVIVGIGFGFKLEADLVDDDIDDVSALCEEFNAELLGISLIMTVFSNTLGELITLPLLSKLSLLTKEDFLDFSLTNGVVLVDLCLIII